MALLKSVPNFLLNCLDQFIEEYRQFAKLSNLLLQIRDCINNISSWLKSLSSIAQLNLYSLKDIR